MKIPADQLLAEVCHSRDNNFNLLRFGAALAVFISHCPGIAGMGVIGITALLGYVGVNAFFAISGFLVTKSLYSRANMRQFIASRVLRIYPALILAVIYTALVVGACFTALPVKDYLLLEETWGFLYRNSLQLFWPIPSRLPGLEWPLANSPLWTLPFELHMYLLLAMVALLAFAQQGRWRKPVWTLYFFSVLVAFGLYAADYAYDLNAYGLGFHSYYLRFLSMFGIGVGLYMLRDKIVLRSRYFLLIVVVVVLASPVRLLFVLLGYGLLAYVLLYLAYIPGGFLRQFNRLGDYSYGVYIFGYPTQKAVMQLMSDISVIELFLISFSLTLGLAVFSWHMLESRVLALKAKW